MMEQLITPPIKDAAAKTKVIGQIMYFLFQFFHQFSPTTVLVGSKTWEIFWMVRLQADFEAQILPRIFPSYPPYGV